MRVTVRQLKGLIREAISEANDDSQLREARRAPAQSEIYYALLVGRERSRLAGVFSSREAAQAALEKHFGRRGAGRPGRAGMIQPVSFEPSDEELAKLYNDMDEAGYL